MSIANSPAQRKRLAALPAAAFTPQWAGYATATLPYHFGNRPDLPLYEIVQRLGAGRRFNEKSFLATRPLEPVPALLGDYPDRWHVEEFFNADQALGWQRAGTYNLNIRYGKMSMTCLAQTAIHQLRQRLGPPYQQWDAAHFARDFFEGLEGDIRVVEDTIVLTFYNAPNAERLRQTYEHLPQKLRAEGVAPEIPWLCNFKLDFRFR